MSLSTLKYQLFGRAGSYFIPIHDMLFFCSCKFWLSAESLCFCRRFPLLPLLPAVLHNAISFRSDKCSSNNIVDLPRTLLNDPFLLFTSPSSFRDQWFANAWIDVGPLMASNPDQITALNNLIHPNAYGVVLEYGPGGGDQLSKFKPLLDSGRVTKVYAAEPNAGLHVKLREVARKVGFTDEQYVILKAGAEPSSLLPALRDAGALPPDCQIPADGLVDTILSIKTLCSFSEKTLKETMVVSQALLKPGGKIIFYEHLGNFTDTITQIYVWFLMWLWPTIIGGCRLDSRLEEVLNGMSGWKDKTWEEAQGINKWAVFRFVKGWVQKA